MDVVTASLSTYEEENIYMELRQVVKIGIW